jgi:hypothetical protein
MNLDDDIHNYYEHLVLERIEILELNKLKMKIIWQTYAVLHSIRSHPNTFDLRWICRFICTKVNVKKWK